MTKCIVTLIVIVLLVPGVVSAQEDLSESYTFQDGTYSFSYPAGWNVEEAQGAAVISDAEPIFDIYNAQLDEFPGENLNLILAPASVLGLEDADIEDRSPTGLVGYVAGAWLVFDENIETLDVNGSPAARVIDGTENRVLDTLIMVVEYETGPLLVIAQTGLNAMEPYVETVMAIVDSITVNADATPGDRSIDPDAELVALNLDSVENIRPIVQTGSEENDFYDAAFSPSGDLVALVNGYHGTVQIVDVMSGAVILEFDAAAEYVMFLDEERVATYEPEAGLSIYSADNGDLLDSYPVENAGSFGLDGDQILGVVAVEADNELGIGLAVIDVATGDAVVRETFDGFEQLEYSLAFGANRAAFAADTSLYMIELPDLELGEPLVTIDTSDPDNEFNSFEAVALSPDGNVVVVTNQNYEITAYEVASGEQLYLIDRTATSSNLSWAAFSLNGSLLFVSERETLLMIDAATGEVLRAVPSTIPGNFEVLEVSDDGRFLVGAAYEALNIWAAPAE